eukprot:CAMPEP_0198267604 /NCGR_PEP_ID=MMETSP1447-20131203/33765_1 /TAXON_ID=420782 /ORGANISM="Chaetoceros dichaeta, Strain CCMP1751" /LENGTH=517 /DNA_ID=CAMNT_0043958273 /DNA_START=102 /DNA_END=1655 /DNA_ORIENTATION=+
MGKGGCVNVSAIKLTARKSAANEKPREITPSFLATKNSIGECWIAYDGDVYDVTRWLPMHPGGIRAIMSAGGQDATSVMKSLHTPYTLKNYMKRVRKVGILSDKTADAPKSAQADELVKKRKNKLRSDAILKDFNALSDKLLNDGWYDATPLQYWAAIIRALLLLVVGVFLILLSRTGSTISLLIGSIMIGIFFENIAFMGHDAGHGSISGDIHIDAWLGFILGNFLTGIDIGWWKSTHYAHHSATNAIHDDPDIQHMPLLCFEERMTDNLWSAYHGKFMPLDALGKLIIPYQNWYFYPVMGVARFNLYIQSVLYLIDTRPFFNRSGTVEKIIDESTGQVKEKYGWPKPKANFWMGQVISLMGFYYVWYCLISCLDIKSTVICIFASHMAAGLLHVQILISHTAMNYCSSGAGSFEADGVPEGTDEAGYYEWQALSTMDVSCPPWMDWAHGGLNFQLEHHLFPRIPRWKLRSLMPLVDEIFNKYDIPVVRVPFIEANRMMLAQMADVGAAIVKMKYS